MTNKESVVIMPNSYGSGSNDIEAFKNATVHLNKSRIKDQETVNVGIYRVKGEWNINQRGTIRAEEFLKEEEKEIKTDQLIAVDKLIREVELLIEEIRTEGEIEDQDLIQILQVIQN
jgi:hypothetical protein